jgi:hypothetical protein
MRTASRFIYYSVPPGRITAPSAVFAENSRARQKTDLENPTAQTRVQSAQNYHKIDNLEFVNKK